MLNNELDLLKKVESFFGVGSIVINKDGSAEYLVRDMAGLNVIRQHFLKFPLGGTKFLDLSEFLKALTIKGSSNYIPLDGNFFNGFIAGDGSLYLNQNIKKEY